MENRRPTQRILSALSLPAVCEHDRLYLQAATAIALAPRPLAFNRNNSFLLIERLRPNWMPFAFASILPSLVRSSILWRSAVATAERIVTAIFPIVPSVVMWSSRNRTWTHMASNCLMICTIQCWKVPTLTQNPRTDCHDP